MAFTRDWDEAAPAGSDAANTIDDSMRNIKVEISDRLKNMLYGLIAGENTLAQHFQYLQLYEQASITTPSAGFGRLSCKAVGGLCELFWKDEGANEIQLSSGGKFVIGYGTASQALMHNTTEEDGENGRESQIRAKGEQSGGEETTLGYIEISHDGTADDQKGRLRIVLNDGDDSDTPSKVAIVFQSDGAIDVGDSVSVLDEDDMASDSATKLATQQSIKKYVDDQDTADHPAYTGGESHTDGSGLIIKMGRTSLADGATHTFTTAFPGGIVCVIATKDSTAGNANVNVSSKLVTGFRVDHDGTGTNIHWIAVGW